MRPRRTFHVLASVMALAFALTAAGTRAQTKPSGVSPQAAQPAGGYVGDGVATSNLAGRTLADLLLGRRSAVTDLPWVGHRSRSWEPEPLRWLGVNAGLKAMSAADPEGRLTRRPSIVARAFARLIHG